MRINADFTQRIVVRPADYRWVASPVQGVERMMLDRIGDEVARATSLVRYAPNSTFPPHVHGGGEEFLVLDGTFGDERRSYPAGTYVRNPIGTSHTPRVGDRGCVIFVKLHQFDPDDDALVVVETRSGNWPRPTSTGIEELHLHRFRDERVSLARWAPDAGWPAHRHDGGEEIFVIEGSFSDEHGDYPAGTWLRSPHASRHEARAGGEGVILYLKTGHLPVSAQDSRPAGVPPT
jgi:anti-sigma factor ChrR (cupin superfamily)